MADTASSETGRIATPPIRPTDASSRKDAATAAKPRATKTPRRPIDEQAILAALDGRIAPVRSTPTYRIGILLTAAFMVLLPLVYVALIAAVAFGVYYHAVYDLSMLELGRGRGKLAVLLVYLAPIVTGGLLILFMFKPLLSRSATREQWRALKPEDQPFLFAFVERVCDAVGAPVPSRIHLDCQVNASASFRRGMISFLGRDLVLTIGMPLVAGMTLRQLAGVLAHEFGHFAQGSGMRLTYVIRSINVWFARVVYERDQWDERLVVWSESIDIRIGWIFYVTRAFVWLTRKILWALMMAGHFVAGYMLRQMEFDADRYEARMSGSDEFAKTSRRLTELNIGYQGAMSDLRDYYREGRLADDVPALIVFNTKQLPPETQAKITEHVKTAKAKWHDTHPGDSDRIASVQREQAEGLFRVEAPASVLFRDYKTLCKFVTRDLYRLFFGENVDQSLLYPTATLIKRTETEQGNYKALARYFRGTFHPLRPLPLERWKTAAPASAKATAEELKTVREEMLAILPRYREAFRKYDEADTNGLYAREAEALHAASLRVQPDIFPIDLSTGEKARQVSTKTARRRGALSHRFEPFEAAAARRLIDALDLLNVPKVRERIEGGDVIRAEADRLLATAEALTSQMPMVLEIRNERGALGVLLSRLDGKTIPPAVVTAIRARMARLAESLTTVHEGLARHQYPFEHAKGEMSLATFIYEHAPDPENPGQLYEAAEILGGTIYRLYGRVFGRLCEIAEEVERLIGLPPLPEPTPRNVASPEATNDGQ